MKHFKLLISYDGTDFSGWQIQPEAVTIMSILKKSFYSVFGKNFYYYLIGASRTDSGVHALGQVALLKTDVTVSIDVLKKAWNNALPKYIYIRSIELVNKKFHPCRNVKQKTYYYNLFLKRSLPFWSRFGFDYKFIDKVDFEKFNQCLNLYIGEHNFASFCKIEDKDKSTVRTIDEIKMDKYLKFNILQIIIKGKSFLRFQIRRMIGYALDVARRDDLDISYLRDILNNPNSQQTLLRAEGCGLILRRIIYDKGVLDEE